MSTVIVNQVSTAKEMRAFVRFNSVTPQAWYAGARRSATEG